MNVIAAVREYVGKVISEAAGMKVLLLDKDTTGIVSMVYTQSEILQKEVYLVDRIESPTRELMTHLKALCFLRPTPENIELLLRELREPKYGQYYLFFTNILSNGDLERLADADEHEVVREVQELFGDFYAVNPDLVSLNITACSSALDVWAEDKYARTKAGVLALLLALKKRPLIRYWRPSAMCRRLASDLSTSMQQEAALFDFRRTDTPPVLLILDRRDDPVTPLLNQWTYQAMVHERLGIHNQRVDLSNVPGIKKDMKEITLSAETDDFYRQNIFNNFGDISMNIKTLVDDFQAKTKTHQQISSIADMRNFIDNYPQFRQMSGTVSKHVAVISELSRLMDAHKLLEVSETEQDLACQGDHTSTLARVRELIDSDKVTDLDRIRLVLLYILRFERNASSSAGTLIDMLKHRHVEEKFVAAARTVLKYGGEDVRTSDMFGNKSFLSFTRKTLKGLKGVQNVYTQHEPLLVETLDELIKGKLRESDYPFVGPMLRDRPQDIIVFMVGGVTYEEARFVAQLNKDTPGVRVVLAGTTIHNAESFLDEVLAATEGRRPVSGR